MIDTAQMSDAEIDEILERFDRTAPKLQRRIIARFIAETANAKDEVERLRAANADLFAALLDAVCPACGFCHGNNSPAAATAKRCRGCDKQRAAIARAKGVAP